MYVKSIKVPNYKGIKNLEIKFQGPLDGQNSINILVGKNGSGKTTILELISDWFTTKSRNVEFGTVEIVNGIETEMFRKISKNALTRQYTTNLNNEIEQLALDDTPPYKYPQIIYLPALIQLHSTKQPRANILNLDYKISVVLKDEMLDKTAAYIKEYIIAAERKLNVANSEERASRAIAQFNKQFESIDLATKLLRLDQNNINTPVFANTDGEELGIENLSDGEKQIYGRLIGLMMLQPHDSIILIDEPDIALHPSWQYKIMELYQSVGQRNQFIIATHSPQVLSSVPWQSIQVLKRSEDQTVVKVLPGPPTGIDSSSVLNEIMGASTINSELITLQAEYRKLFDEKMEDTDTGVILRDKLLSVESEHSSFFQELKFLKMIRDEES